MQNSSEKFLITIVGPTAIGKTALSLKLANYFNTSIISADSRQFYKEMNIGTAVPSIIELSAAQHHFIQHKSITENYSVGEFERDAISKLNGLFKTKPVVIMVGGSGLFVKAVTEGLDHFPKVDPAIREKLNTRLKTEGLIALQNQLKLLDKKSYETVALDNPKRVIRALEVCIETGKPYSSYLKNTKKTRNFTTISIGLNADRDIIYERINQRVDLMIEDGLLQEVKTLIPHKNLNALNTVGYKELFAYFEDELSLKAAIEAIKRNTRRFAKRQLTWFKKNNAIKWFDYKTKPELIINYIKSKM